MAKGFPCPFYPAASPGYKRVGYGDPDPADPDPSPVCECAEGCDHADLCVYGPDAQAPVVDDGGCHNCALCPVAATCGREE